MLASGSPRRVEILAMVLGRGVDFERMSSDFEESGGKDGEQTADVAAYSLAMARGKVADVVARQLELERKQDTMVVIGSDTCVVSPSGLLLEKPVNQADHQRMMRLLSGRTHRVVTAVVMHRVDGGDVAQTVEFVDEALVTFAELDEPTIACYTAPGTEGDDKAGGYGLQGIAGANFVEKIDGVRTSLPLSRTRVCVFTDTSLRHRTTTQSWGSRATSWPYRSRKSLVSETSATHRYASTRRRIIRQVIVASSPHRSSRVQFRDGLITSQILRHLHKQHRDAVADGKPLSALFRLEPRAVTAHLQRAAGDGAREERQRTLVEHAVRQAHVMHGIPRVAVTTGLDW